jgi:hypothetical protein
LGDIEQHLQNTLQAYGIGRDEWNLLKTSELLNANGRNYLTPRIKGERGKKL